MARGISLPAGITVVERGWLSSNNILFHGRGPAALVDSGYASHSAQTVALVRNALGTRPLDLLLNTHLHSDHCGGNAALQSAYPMVQTLIPPGQAAQVRQWDPVALSYEPTGQECPPFRFDALLVPGAEVVLNELRWEVHGARGHDPHSVVLFEPRDRVLLSADALWENGFGVVFPELEGRDAFDEVRGTLDIIEKLDPSIVVPGHGRTFGGREAVSGALAAARRRLSRYVADPVWHARHAAKVLLKFKLLEVQRVDLSQLQRWATGTPYFMLIRSRYFPNEPAAAWFRSLVDDLIAANAARMIDGEIFNA
jgi:glyoxylase-like metal-dependent hydrolase (beta-lactamase superfamily II)